jgi:Flp pilus assembly protein TadD
MFSAGRFQDVVNMAEGAIEASGEDYNVYGPIMNALGALGKDEAKRNLAQRRIVALEKHLKPVPEDARARVLLAVDYVAIGRNEEAIREANLAMALRPNEATVVYNLACVFCALGRKAEGMDALRKAWQAGFRESDWARRDPDLALLHGDPEFDKMYPPTATSE